VQVISGVQEYRGFDKSNEMRACYGLRKDIVPYEFHADYSDATEERDGEGRKELKTLEYQALA
jgi:hypothetical protein